MMSSSKRKQSSAVSSIQSLCNADAILTFKMKPTRLLLTLATLVLLCSCASSGRKVIATKHTILHQSTVVAEYPVTVPDSIKKEN